MSFIHQTFHNIEMSTTTQCRRVHNCKYTHTYVHVYIHMCTTKCNDAIVLYYIVLDCCTEGIHVHIYLGDESDLNLRNNK